MCSFSLYTLQVSKDKLFNKFLKKFKTSLTLSELTGDVCPSPYLIPLPDTNIQKYY